MAERKADKLARGGGLADALRRRRKAYESGNPEDMAETFKAVLKINKKKKKDK